MPRESISKPGRKPGNPQEAGAYAPSAPPKPAEQPATLVTNPALHAPMPTAPAKQDPPAAAGVLKGATSPLKAPKKSKTPAKKVVPRKAKHGIKRGSKRGTKRGGRRGGSPRLSLGTYIHRVLKRDDKERVIGSEAIAVLNDLINDLLRRLCDETKSVISYVPHKTISARDVQSAVRLIVSGELAKHAIGTATKAIATFTKNSDKKEK